MKTLILAAAALIAAPAIAQTAPAQTSPSATPQAQNETQAQQPRMKRMEAGRMKHRRGPMFENVSAEGREILFAAMRKDMGEHRAEMRAARDRINSLVGAEKLDVAALKKAMDAERKLVDAHHARRQTAMLEAFQKLSPADRKAFAEDAGKSRARVEARTKEWRERAEQRRERMRTQAPPAAS